MCHYFWGRLDSFFTVALINHLACTSSFGVQGIPNEYYSCQGCCGITHADWHHSNKSVSYEHAWIGIRSVILPTPTFGCSSEVAGGIRVSEWVAPFVFSTKWNQLRRSTKSKAGEGKREREAQMNGRRRKKRRRP